MVFSANPRIDLIHETVKWQDQCVREDEIAYMRSELPGSGRKLRPQKVGFKATGGGGGPRSKKRFLPVGRPRTI